MKKTNKDKLFKSIISIGIAGAILLLLSIPFIPGYNYSPFNVLGVEVTPTQEYRIQFDLPHIKPVSPEVREKAEAHLSKLFDISQSSLKNGVLLSKPFVDIKELPITNSYIGSIKIGNATIPFSKVTKQFNDVSKDNNTLQSKELLTAYFRVNGKPLRANIFIMSRGSVLQYASMTLQDKEDNVLAMFTYGRALSNRKTDERTNTQKIQKNTSLDKTSISNVSSTNIVLRSIVKDITIGAYGTSRTVHGLRTDAMIRLPFNTNSGSSTYPSIRTWGFKQAIIDTYKSIYTGLGYDPSTIYIHFGIGKVDDVIEAKYPAKGSTDDNFRFPVPSWYSNIPLSVSFSILGIGISYPISIPDGGVKKTWTYTHTSADGSDVHDYNCAEFIADPFYDYTWNDKHLFWPDDDYNNPYLQNPSSHYGGFYAYQTFVNAGSGSGFYARFTSSYTYTISISVPLSGTDYYYFSVYNTLDNVRLDVKRPKH